MLFVGSTIGYSQAYRNYDQNQEVKFNIGLFLASTTVEGSYEYFFTEDTSVGGTIYYDNTPQDYNGSFGIGPNFRAYFGYAPRSGFFAEAFGLFRLFASILPCFARNILQILSAANFGEI